MSAGDEKSLSARAEELRQETAALSALLAGYASKAEVEQQLADERTLTKELISERGRNRNIVLICLAVALFAVVVVLARVNDAASDAKHAVVQSNVDRQERSRGSCIQFNINQSNTREAIVQGLVETFRPLVQPGREADLERFATSLRTNVEHLLPYRDCSDAGIEAFLKNPPHDPSTGG